MITKYDKKTNSLTITTKYRVGDTVFTVVPNSKVEKHKIVEIAMIDFEKGEVYYSLPQRHPSFKIAGNPIYPRFKESEIYSTYEEAEAVLNDIIKKEKELAIQRYFVFKREQEKAMEELKKELEGFYGINVKDLENK